MPKHLKVRVESIGKEMAELTILEQSHVHNFSEKGLTKRKECHAGCFQHGRVILIGDGMGTEFIDPRVKHPMLTYDELWLCLQYHPSKVDRNKIKFPAKHWPELREAIEAYNEWGKDKN